MTDVHWFDSRNVSLFYCSGLTVDILVIAMCFWINTLYSTARLMSDMDRCRGYLSGCIIRSNDKTYIWSCWWEFGTGCIYDKSSFAPRMSSYQIDLKTFRFACAFINVPTLYHSELPRPIPWNQTSDVHRGSALITCRRRYITWRWRYRNHANTITSVKTNGFKWS